MALATSGISCSSLLSCLFFETPYFCLL
ncbi:hypothetical protein GMOD_00000016 [Pyrenophora seminiperda CCB06]|uniref:Uncharacterized protein n=1 Tax=Pyrenophora seminiperda CCB06 TaxID=1302712 RepID=A0A3M7M662_9PLEO|nr:hypothetical protein GMOD_00000016 [Pyrenophora seminiperda CCB06]